LDTNWKAQRLALLLGVFVALLVFRRRALRPITYSWLLLVLVLGDLASANRNLNQGMPWRRLDDHAPLIDPAEARRQGQRIFHGQTIASTTDGAADASLRLTRWDPMITRYEDLAATYGSLWETLNSNAGMFYGIANVSGSDGITSARDDLLLQVIAELPLDHAVKLLSVFATGYVLGPDPLPVFNLTEIPSGRETSYHAFRVHDPVPLVYAVSHLQVAPSPEAALFRLGSDDFLPGREAIVEALPSGWQNWPRDVTPAVVTMLARRDDLWRFRVDANTPCLVVVNESFFPGWEAWVDGAPSSIIRTNAIVRGVAVGAGSHLVEFSYRPRSFRWGATISLATALLISLAALRAHSGRRRT
jgi:hypothetical protein